MADDPDMEKLAEAFAALERSRQRLDALIERESRRGPSGEPRTISDLLGELEEGTGILTDVERRILIDYMTSRLAQRAEAAGGARGTGS